MLRSLSRCFALILVTGSCLAPLTAFAADTYTLPYSVVPGTVVYHPAVDPSYSVSLPFSLSFDPVDPFNCVSDSSSFLVSEEGGALQIAFDVFVSSAGTFDCELLGSFTMDVEVNVAELGGTSTDVRLEVSVPIFNFGEYYIVQSKLTTIGDVSSSALGPDRPYAVNFENTSRWEDTRFATPVFQSSPGVSLQPLIPGDTVRIPLRIEILASGETGGGSDTIGDIRLRYELKVTYSPEPSAALSLPIGALGLIGLASLRGGA
jgi:hypothetical protein